MSFLLWFDSFAPLGYKIFSMGSGLSIQRAREARLSFGPNCFSFIYCQKQHCFDYHSTHPLFCPALQFTDKQLYFFLKSFRSEVASVHRDTVVSVSNIQSNPIWALDRLDQVDLPLDNAYNYYNSGTGVHVYIVDTVSTICRV